MLLFVLVTDLAMIIQNYISLQDSCNLQEGTRKQLWECHLLAFLSLLPLYVHIHVRDRTAVQSINEYGNCGFRSRADQIHLTRDMENSKIHWVNLI